MGNEPPAMLPAFSVTGVITVLLLAFHHSDASSYACGDYLRPSNTGSGQFTTLNYPDVYPPYTYCSWLIEAPSNYSVVVNISAIVMGNAVDDTCPDYVEIQDGDGTVLLHNCSTDEPQLFQSSNRWMWIYYKTDFNNSYMGFYANYYTLYIGAVDGSSPISDCQGVSYVCRNQQCVPWAYMCDHYNDCGCTDSGCDESGCGGIDWSENQKLLCGISVGTASFVFLFLGIGLLELWLKKRQEEEDLRQVEEERQRSRRRRPPPKPKSVDPSPERSKDAISTNSIKA